MIKSKLLFAYQKKITQIFVDLLKITTVFNLEITFKF